MPEKFEGQNHEENQPEEEIQPYVEPHDEIFKKYPDDLIINDWWINLPGGRPKIGEFRDEPVGGYHKRMAKEWAKREGKSEEEVYKLNTHKLSEKRLKLSDFEFHKIIEDKIKEVGIDIEKIKKINERMNEIDDMHPDQRTGEISLERDRLLREIEKRTGIVRRMLLRDGFLTGDLGRA